MEKNEGVEFLILSAARFSGDISAVLNDETLAQYQLCHVISIILTCSSSSQHK